MHFEVDSDKTASSRTKRSAAVFVALASIAWITACTPPPPVDQRGALGSVYLDLTHQHANLHSPTGELVARIPVSTGASGRTPPGTYRVTRKSLVGTSSSDSNVHMDYFTRFNGGIGFHGIPWKYDRSRRISTPLGVRPVSAGCVRMSDDLAEWIFFHLPVGAPVIVSY